MIKKKILIYSLLPLFLGFFVLVGYFTYLTMQKPCAGEGWPLPPPSLYFGPYYMITDQGPLYVGQTYEHRNEGPWVGNITLLLLENKGATFLLRYPQSNGRDTTVKECKKYYPRTPENDPGK